MAPPAGPGGVPVKASAATVSASTADRAKAVLQGHRDGCPACDAGLNAADTGIEGFHALCASGKAVILEMLPEGDRAFVVAADRALTSLDAQAVAS